ncbi:hypothetical protein JQC67_05995 [Aurantibacter crassamenti]|uniref:hypothetical protein n=1 Tax=Aurantibacter crassamenti TaxID=1837375 RepID=UPI00193A0ADF|nr:hypothetical protein [Aurantibacter crassamenti]MBM1105689.1 hypothetical protein [Aurantibacter crassamenti]
MNRLIAILLLVSFHAQPAMVISVWADYCMNNEYIREVLCINKEKPKLECDGKCYLATMLKKESQKKESDEKMLFSEVSVTPVFFVTNQDITFNTIEFLTTVENFFYSDHYHLLSHTDRDRPPIVA